MEEDIKILEDMIEKFRTINEDTYEKEDLWTMCKYKHYKAIENLIARYKELEEKKNIQVAYGGRRYNTEGIILKDFIPKSKVKEKIEEYNKMIESTYQEFTHPADVRRDNCLEIRNVLRKLLES